MLLAPRAAGLAELVGHFDNLIERHQSARGELVITHGEPHPGNVMSVDDDIVLIDWDTVALAVPERDLWMIVGSDFVGAQIYERAVGREINRDAITMYELRWYLDDIGSEVRMFRNPHLENADTERYIEALPALLRRLPEWLQRFS